jgi:hypothetical protein
MTAINYSLSPTLVALATDTLVTDGRDWWPAFLTPRHATRDAGEHYVHPDARFVESIQKKRLAHRNKTRVKVGKG